MANIKFLALTMVTSMALLFSSCDDISIEPGDTETFVKFYGNAVDNAGADIIQTTDGFIIVGRVLKIDSLTEATTDYDMLILKIDDQGNEQWNYQLGGDFDDEAKGICPTHDGQFLVIGTNTIAADESSMYLVKVSNEGDTSWTKNVPEQSGNPIVGGNAITPTHDGGYIGVGYYRSSASAGKNVSIVKFNGNGDPTDSERFGSDSFDDEAFAILEKWDAKNGRYEYAMATTINSTVASVVSPDNNTTVGAIVFLENNFGTKDGGVVGIAGGITTCNAIAYENDTTFYLVGSSNIMATGSVSDFDAYIAKIYRPSSGTESSPAWVRTFGGPEDDSFNDFVTEANAFIMTGNQGKESMIVRTNLDGIIDNAGWQKAFGSIPGESQMESSINAVTYASGTGYIMTGISRFASTTIVSVTKTNFQGEVGR